LFAVQRYEPIVRNIASENEAVRRALGDKRKQLEQMRGQFARIQGTLFTPRQAKEFFADLQNIAEKAGCTVTSVSLLPDQPGPMIKQGENTLLVVGRSVTLGVLAPYDDIVRLLESLERRDQRVWIDSLGMELFDADAVKLKCSFTITIYTIQNKEAAVDE
jgi:hypothetical protein